LLAPSPGKAAKQEPGRGGRDYKLVDREFGLIPAAVIASSRSV
jgi:hypothetical protein